MHVLAVATSLALGLAGCGDDEGGSDDGGSRADGGRRDGALADARGIDSPPFDAGPAIVAASCERDDVAAAVATAEDGSTVLIPPGTCSWTVGLEILGKGIHLTGGTLGAVTIVHDAGSATLVELNEDTTHHLEISRIRFEEGSGGAEAWDGMFLSVGGTTGGRAVLVHDMSFEMNNSGRRAIRFTLNRGVIWGSEFYSNEQDANCIAFIADDSSWMTPSTMGTDDAAGESNVYVEDNVFRQIPAQALDPDSNSRVVIRHNTFDESAIASHGADTSEDGTRHWELYDNTFTFTDHGDCDGSLTANLPYLFYIRGGTGIIADNVIPDVASCAWSDKSELYMTVQNLRRDAGLYACWTTYPAPRQVGQGHDGTSQVLDPVYLWGNTGGGNYDDPGVGDYEPDECGNDTRTADFIQAGRDYIVDTPRPGYAKYAYPHPLRAGR